MSYTTTVKVKAWMDILTAALDEIIDDKVEEVDAIIDMLTKTTFETGVAAARSFHTYNDVSQKGILLLDEWMVALTSVVNGDSEDITSDTFLLPTNVTPKWGIGLKSESWTTDDDGYPQDAITVTATWGWSTTAPVEIRSIATELCAHLVQTRRDPQQQGITFAEGGQIIIPNAWPPRVWKTCQMYHRYSV